MSPKIYLLRLQIIVHKFPVIPYVGVSKAFLSLFFAKMGPLLGSLIMGYVVAAAVDFAK